MGRSYVDEKRSYCDRGSLGNRRSVRRRAASPSQITEPQLRCITPTVGRERRESRVQFESSSPSPFGSPVGLARLLTPPHPHRSCQEFSLTFHYIMAACRDTDKQINKPKVQVIDRKMLDRFSLALLFFSMNRISSWQLLIISPRIKNKMNKTLVTQESKGGTGWGMDGLVGGGFAMAGSL